MPDQPVGQCPLSNNSRGCQARQKAALHPRLFSAAIRGWGGNPFFLPRCPLTRYPVSMVREERRSGYTLIELLIVMAVIAMVAAVGIPLFARSLDRAELKSAAGEMASLMRLARQEAIARKTVFSTVIDPARKAAYAIEGRFDAGNPAEPFNGAVVTVPQAARIWTPNGGLLLLEFSPAGTATACDFSVTSTKAVGPDDENGYRVTLDPLSGRARVTRNKATVK